jgi:hypothetical protein
MASGKAPNGAFLLPDLRGMAQTGQPRDFDGQPMAAMG